MNRARGGSKKDALQFSLLQLSFCAAPAFFFFWRVNREVGRHASLTLEQFKHMPEPILCLKNDGASGLDKSANGYILYTCPHGHLRLLRPVAKQLALIRGCSVVGKLSRASLKPPRMVKPQLLEQPVEELSLLLRLPSRLISTHSSTDTGVDFRGAQ